MEFKEMSVEELESRKAELGEEVKSLDSLEEVEARGTEIAEINAELEERKSLAEKKAEVRQAVAEGAGDIITEKIIPQESKKMTVTEERAAKLTESNKATYKTEEIRSVLISGGTVATPTGVAGINDTLASHNSILDLIKVVNCVGMGSNKVAYIAAESAYAADQTEGNEATTKEPTFGYVTIQPTSIACKAQISKQAKKQSPLDYEAKVNALALQSLRKAVVNKVVAAMAASSITKTTTVSGTAIDEKTLREIVFDYGTDEDICGSAVLFLTKANLVAFGDVRGTNEKKAVYDITPDGSNPNIGTIADGGLVVKYCLVNGLDNMFYGDPTTIELDLFSDYEVRVSEDFAFTSLMDTIVGDCEVGADIVVKYGLDKIAFTSAG